MPKRLLRGIIDFGDNRITIESRNQNYQTLTRSKYVFNNPDERKIYEYVKAYVQENLDPPTAASIRDYFEATNEVTVTEKLLDIKAVEPYSSHSYKNLLKLLQDEQNQILFKKLVQEVEEIVTRGRVVEKKTLKGVKDGLMYFNEKVYELLPPEGGIRTDGEVTHDVQAEWDAYQEAKVNTAKVYGKFTGISLIDTVCRGIKKGELWIHAAEPGGLKTTFALNWAYNLVTRYRTNVLYVSLEMSYEHIRKIICAIHTSNGTFLSKGHKPLDYRKIRDGQLSPEEEKHYQNVLYELEGDPENYGYCRLNVWHPDRDVTVNDIRIYAELLHKSMELGMIIIDHDDWVKSIKSYKDYTIERNSIIKDLKKMALRFDGGAGIPVLDLHQINRKGMNSVEKAKGTEEEGAYKYSDLSYANDAERVADYITTSWATPNTIEQGYAKIGNMKNRDNMKFKLSKVSVDMSCHRIYNWVEPEGADFSSEELADSI